MIRLGAASIVAAIAASAIATIGCAAGEPVVRVVDGRAVAGDYVPPDAYAAYLNGAIAEASGHLEEAIAAFEAAAAMGPADPEPWTRAGLARCQRDPRDADADRAFARALAIDEGYAPAWEARARCALLRGPEAAGAAAEDARRALASDPRAAGALAALAATDERGDRAVRDRLLARTLAMPTDVTAWRALATWGALHGDAAIEARALGRAGSLGDRGDREGALAAAVRRMVGDGALPEARALAHDEARAGRASAARLAVDDAILAGDREEVARLCVRAHLPRAVAAARALLLGDAATARALVEPVVRADPRALEARLVLASVAGDGGGEGSGASAEPARLAMAGAPSASSDRVAIEPWLAYARLLARRGSPDAARASLSLLDATSGLADDDPLVTPVVVALAAQGVIEPRALGPNATIELAERRGERVDASIVARADARHALLALARSAPQDAATLDRARRLAPLRDRDRLVAVAFARLALGGAPGVTAADDALAKLDPADPLVAAAALDLALRAQDARVIPLARARLAAVARTPAELARLH